MIRKGDITERFRPRRFKHIARYPSEMALVLAAYFLAGKIGLAAPFTSGNVSPVWPAAGIALAAMLLVGYRVWPAVAIGAFLVNLLSPIPHAAALGLVLGNTAGPLTGAWLLRRISGFQPALTRLRDALGLIVFAALGGTAISATIGTYVLSRSHVNPWSNFESAWLIWWLGDAMGVLIVVPLVLTFAELFSIRENRRLLELAGLLLGAAVSSLLIFEGRLGSGVGRNALAFGVFPFVIWGATRFKVAGAATTNFLICAVAVWETARGSGPFVTSNALQNAILLQAFLAVISASGMILAALVTERAQLIRDQTAREERLQSLKRFGEIAETANEGIWVLNSQLLTCFVNRRMAELLGYTTGEMVGKPVLEFLYQEDVEQKRADLERRKRGVSEQRDDRLRRKDGSELWASVSTTPSFSVDGRFEGVLAMVRDITDQKRSEAERRNALKTIMLLSQAVEQTADSVLVTDKRGIIEYVNSAFEATTGYGREEALGKTPRILKSGQHDSDFYKRLWSLLLLGQPFRGTLVNRKKAGELYWAEQTITPIRDDNGNITHFVSVLKDITALRRKQEQEVQLRLAREVQQRFYTAPIAVPGLDAAAAAYPADETGGDYFDFIPMPEGSLYIGIGDASGHGLDSALVMALTRAYVRSFASMGLDVGEILTRVNRMLVADLEDGRFVTLLLVRLDSSHGSLAYASAGHVPGYVLNSDGEVESVMASTGPPMGLFQDSGFSSVVIALKPQQLILLVTDGAIEIADACGSQFGVKRILAHTGVHCHDPALHIAEGIYQAARAFAGDEPPFDDITSVVVKVTADSRSTAAG